MENSTGPVRAGSLVLELAARTVIVDGRRVELPPTEFSLLAVLAARAGQVVPHKELLQEAFGDSTYMNAQDLHWRIWNVRKLIGDGDKTIIRNRRGVGFLLEQGTVTVVEGAADAPAEPAADEIRLDEEPPRDPPAPDAAIRSTVVVTDEPAGRRFVLSPLTLLVLGLVAGLALGGSWLAGYTLSEPQSRDSSPAPRQEFSGLDEEGPDRARSKKTSKERERRGREKRGGRRESKRRPLLASAGPQAPTGVGPNESSASTAVSSAPDTSDNQPAPQQAPRQTAPKNPQPPSYPPAPTRYLYHLVNPQTGDHFVTTESGTASEYQAMGYEGGAIARVYTYREKDTKAVSTNEGTAYIFSSASPKTEPASSTVPLWYSSNGKGDFFYTANESEAKRSGWQGSLIGYARSL